MQAAKSTLQIHPSSVIGTVTKIDRTSDPYSLYQSYAALISEGTQGFAQKLSDFLRRESIVIRLIVFLKYEFEQTILENIFDKSNWDQVLKNAYDSSMENPDEVPDLSRIMNMIRQSKMGIDTGIARILLERILLDYKLHLTVFSRDSAILANLDEEYEVLSAASPVQLTAYVIRFRELRTDFSLLEDEINAYNDAEKKMDELEMDFLDSAGSLEVAFQELSIEEQKLEWKIAFKKTHPGATPEEIDVQLQVAMENMKEELKKLAELKSKTGEAKLHKAYEKSFLTTAFGANNGENTGSDKYLLMLKSESRSEIKKTIKRAHPDILNNNAHFDDLSEEQKIEIDKLLNEELEQLEKIDNYSSKMSSEYFTRLIEKTRETRKKIDRLLKFSGIPVNPDFIIEGNTIEKRLADIQERMNRIDFKILEWKIKKKNLPKDAEKKRKVKIMETLGLDAYIAELKMQINQLKIRTAELEQGYKALSNH